MIPITVLPDRITIGAEFVPRFLDLPQVLQIPVGETVELPVDSTFDYIEVAGTLRISRTHDTTVRFTHLFVLPGGHLDCGIEEDNDPIPANIHATFILRDTPIDTTRDPFQWGNGLLNFGRQDRCGAPKLAQTTLTGDANLGATAVTLSEDPIGWEVGDELLFPDTEFASTRREALVTITDIVGRTVSLSKPLDFAHLTQTDPDGGIILLPPVANLTRNITVRSENPDGTRGHTADVGMTAMWCICWNQLSGLGRTKAEPLNSAINHIAGTNQVGRYTDHHHHAMGFGSSSTGNVLRGPGGSTTGKWGLVIHGTHDALITENIAIDFFGAGFVTEDGYEVRNTYLKNFAAYNLGNATGSLMLTESNIINLNPGSEGSGFWLRGVQNTLDRNQGWCNSVGINLVNIGAVDGSFPSIPGGDPDTPLVQSAMTPILVTDNIVASNHVFGLELWGTPKFPNTNLTASFNGDSQTIITISNFLVPYFVNPTLVGKDGQSTAIHTSSSYTGELTVEGGRIVGSKIGVFDGGAQHLYLRNVEMQNVVNLDAAVSMPIWMEHRDVLHRPLPGFTPQYITFGNGIVWPGTGPFPTITNDFAWTMQRGSRWQIYNWQRHSGEDYRLFEPKSLGSAAAWPSSAKSGHQYNCPETGITNAESWQKYGMSYDGDMLPDIDAIHLDGLITGLVGRPLAPTLGPSRAIITYPTTREAAVAEHDNDPGPFVWLYGLITGTKLGASEVIRYQVDGGTPIDVNLAGYVDERDSFRIQVRVATEGLHEIKTWRLTPTGAEIPESAMTFFYSIGVIIEPPPPPPVDTWEPITSTIERFGTTNRFRLRVTAETFEFQMKP